ncbi:Copia protein [Gracilariopsis chorda]|uniref:Copia protein n=1 Tax=Gracilariopsis chorda TaxID=448386 RepID=A0A2V3IXZ3_9FLOR|nr:Copia protein [Gracilariopsis chorda]|eukprot:PXF47018.1 Copia protein [Gracilariopsis chorda]
MLLPDADEWKVAISNKIASLNVHKMWDVVDRSADMNPIGSRVGFLRKTNSHGLSARYKARLVVRGFMIGFIERTYAPVVDYNTVRLVLGLSVQRGYKIHQMDIKTGFLHREIDETIYILPPKGLEICKSHEVLKLRNSLYGLKQAPRQ